MSKLRLIDKAKYSVPQAAPDAAWTWYSDLFRLCFGDIVGTPLLADLYTSQRLRDYEEHVLPSMIFGISVEEAHRGRELNHDDIESLPDDPSRAPIFIFGRAGVASRPTCTISLR